MYAPPLAAPRPTELSPMEIARSSSSPPPTSGGGVGGGLESSLLHLIRQHNHISLQLRDHTERAKKDATRKATRVSELLVDAVNGGVEESFVNQKSIELEIRALSATILRFSKHTDQWLAASHSINSAIKEIGDFENWMKTMEFDCRSVNAAVRNIHQA